MVLCDVAFCSCMCAIGSVLLLLLLRLLLQVALRAAATAPAEAKCSRTWAQWHGAGATAPSAASPPRFGPDADLQLAHAAALQPAIPPCGDAMSSRTLWLHISPATHAPPPSSQTFSAEAMQGADAGVATAIGEPGLAAAAGDVADEARLACVHVAASVASVRWCCEVVLRTWLLPRSMWLM